MDDLLKQQWYPLCQKSDLALKKPLRCLLFNTPIVLYKMKNEIIAFIDRCPHRGAPLSSGKIIEGELQCPYHGWQFKKDGKCKHVPGLCSPLNPSGKSLTPVNIELKCDLVFACLSVTDNTFPLFKPSHYADKNYHSFTWPSQIKGSLINVLENFLDGCHTHFIHSGLLRTQTHRQTIKAQLNVTENNATVLYHDGKIQTGLISKLFEPERTHSIASFHYPMIAQIEYFNNTTLHFSITVFICPNNDNTFKVFSVLTHPQTCVPNIIKKMLFMPFIKMALRQDKRILALQQDNLSHFKDEAFCSTELDILRSHIERILERKSKDYHKSLDINL